MRCLSLAFENFEDLPKNWKEFDIIDAYGFSKLSEEDIEKFVGNSRTKLKICNQFFEIQNFLKPEQSYHFCFIRHPDPWGEPRNWLQAIAALGECLKGKLSCEFWFPHEIVAFNFLLISLLGKENIKFFAAQQIEDAGEWKNYEARWKINSAEIQSNMLSTYQKKKDEILQRFYREIGKSYRDSFTLEEVKL